MSVQLQLSSQMNIDGNIVFGNEWIDFDRDYYKMTLSEDGVYRVYGSDLSENGIDLSQFQAEELQLVHWGKQIPMYVSTDGAFTANDFIEFIGRKNTGELDKQVFIGWEENQLNLEYSNFTDQSAYFLSWESGSNNNLRINDENSIINSSNPEETYYLHNEDIVFNQTFTKPSYTENVRYSHFDTAEGFGSGYARETKIDFNVTNLVETNEFLPKLNLRAGTNATTHDVAIQYSDREIYSDLFSGYNIVELDSELQYSDLQGNNTLVVYGNFDANDRYTVAHSTLVYPRTLTFDPSPYIEIQTRENSDDFNFNIDQFDNTATENIIIDETENKRYTIIPSNNRIKFSLAAGASSRKVHLLNSNKGYKSVTAIEERRFVDYNSVNPSYALLTSERLNSNSSNSSVNQYAEYRSSEMGGSYSTFIVNVEDLYDQFSYGINRNPISVRNFIHFVNPSWSELEFLFIIGKGVEYASYRTEEQISDPTTPPFFVPTWGFPGSDNLLLAEKSFSAPIVSVGRIAVREEVEITNYLNKVIDHDLIYSTNQTLEDKLWTKEIIHLSGGDPAIQESLYSHLGKMEEIIETSTFGADVTTFRKSSADPLQSATSSEILNKINQGKAIITFFGHSGVGTFDFSLEDVAEWQNERKLPMIISLGCHSGNIHGTSNTLGLSESFVLEPERGAILFLASSSSAFISPQAVAGKAYYDLFGNTNFDKPVGRSIQDYLESQNTVQSLSVKSLNQQLTFHGDPAVKFYSHPSPDYIVDFSSLTIKEENVTISDENFELQFDIVNLGRTSNDSLDVRVIHYLPDNSIFKEYTRRVGNVRFKKEIQFTLNNPGIVGAGKNRVDIILDPSLEIAELPDPEAEENNTLSNLVEEGFCFFISSNIIKPKFPSNFSIINTNDITYLATGNNASNPSTTYILEIDTSAVFAMPLVSEQITQENGTIEWSPTFNYVDGTVYYWRISPMLDNPLWQSSSFIYLPNESEGWNQSHYYQYLDDNLESSRFKDRSLSFPLEYEETTLNLFVPDNSTVRPRYRRDNTPLGSAKLWDIPETGICVLLRDPLDLSFVTNVVPGQYGSWSQNSTRRIFFFATDKQTKRIDLVNFLEDVVEDGYHVFLNTIHNDLDGDLYSEEWAQDSLLNNGKNIFNVLESYGATSIRKMESKNTHYGLFLTKGGIVHDETFSESLSEGINLAASLASNASEGVIESVLIGPSASWFTLNTQIEGIESHDSVSINVIGLDKENNESLLYENVPLGLFDLSEIPADLFPYIKLRYFGTDEINRTFPQIKYWRVYHKEIPELIYDTPELLSFSKSKLYVGESLSFSASIKNITRSDMDSILVKYSIIDENNNNVFNYQRNEELPAQNTNEINFMRSTDDMSSGNYQFIVELNPDNDQIEQEHYDNFCIIPFEVLGDRINPVLDVSFDGKHIINGETVSKTPTIEIILSDPDATLALDDVTDFQIALFHPDGSRETVDLLTDSRIDFFPGSAGSNMARLIFTPNLEPGEYSFVAQAKDRSGNFSGSLEYSVVFNISDINSIGEILLFPNPSINNDINILIPLTGNDIPEALEFTVFTALEQKKLLTVNTKDYGLTLGAGVNVITISQSTIQAMLPAGVYYYTIDLPVGINGHSEFNLKEKVGSFVVIH